MGIYWLCGVLEKLALSSQTLRLQEGSVVTPLYRLKSESRRLQQLQSECGLSLLPEHKVACPGHLAEVR